MGFRFRRSLSILPGIRLNFGKRGISTSIGVRGAHITYGPTGTRTTVGLPGTGLSYTHLQKSRHPAAAHPATPVNPGAVQAVPGSAPRGTAWIVIVIIVVITVGRWAASPSAVPNESVIPRATLPAAAARVNADKAAEIEAAVRGAAQLRSTIANARTLKFSRIALSSNGAVCYQMDLKNSRGVPYVRTAVLDGAVLRVSGSTHFDVLWNRRCGQTQDRDITADVSRRR